MGSLLSGRTSQEKGYDQQIGNVVAGQEGRADMTMSRGKKDVKAGTKALRGPLDFYNTLLQGDRTAIGQLIAPEAKAISEGYQRAEENVAETAPRGGAVTTAMANLEGKKASQVGELYTTARSRGAEGAAGIGQMLAQIGLSQEQISTVLSSQVLQALLAQKQGEMQHGAQKSAGIGGLIGGGLGLVGSFL
jgi:hypothetical protein